MESGFHDLAKGSTLRANPTGFNATAFRQGKVERSEMAQRGINTLMACALARMVTAAIGMAAFPKVKSVYAQTQARKEMCKAEKTELARLNQPGNLVGVLGRYQATLRRTC